MRGAFGGPRLEKLDSGVVRLPGFHSDLIVGADRGLFYRLWSEHIEYDASLRRGTLVVEGPLVLGSHFR